MAISQGPPDPDTRHRRPAPAHRLQGVRHDGELAAAVRDAIAVLGGPAPFSLVMIPRIDRSLREAVADHLDCRRSCERIAVCVRVACAHLTAGNVEQARLALLETKVAGS